MKEFIYIVIEPRVLMFQIMKYSLIAFPIYFLFFEKRIMQNARKRIKERNEKEMQNTPINNSNVLETSNNANKFRYRFDFINKTYTLTQQQKIIYSIAVLIIGFFVTAAIAAESTHRTRYGPSHYFSDTWYIWVIYCLIELYIQNKIWSEVFKFRYPVVNKIKEI
jgi:hypothetical protein